MRRIEGLYETAVERLERNCGPDVFQEKERSLFEVCFDVILNEHVVLKVWNDHIEVGLWGHKDYISFDDFVDMEME